MARQHRGKQAVDRQPLARVTPLLHSGTRGAGYPRGYPRSGWRWTGFAVTARRFNGGISQRCAQPARMPTIKVKGH